MAAVLALADGLGLSRAPTLQALSGTPLLEGRLERVEAGQPFEVIIDFAHSPDSIDRVLEHLGTIAKENAGRLIAVLGMAPTGERMTREACGRIARTRADHLVLSAWSIRGEPQLLSLAWVLAGARAAQGARLEIVIQRRAAIARALSLAAPGRRRGDHRAWPDQDAGAEHAGRRGALRRPRGRARADAATP